MLWLAVRVTLIGDLEGPLAYFLIELLGLVAFPLLMLIYLERVARYLLVEVDIGIKLKLTKYK